MRVLMLTDQYPPLIGGIERHVRNLAAGLAERGHHVAVATSAVDGLPADEFDGAVHVHRLRSTAQRASGAATPSGRPYAPPFPDPEVVLGLREIVAREQPDIVHGHNWFARSYLPLKESGRAAFVMSLHDYGVVCAKRSLWYRGEACGGPEFSKCLHCAANNYGTARGMAITLGNWSTAPAERRAVDMYLPVSRAVVSGNRLVEDDLPFKVVPNFVPDDVAQTANPDHPALAALPKKPFWLFVGTLSRNKGIDVLLDAYRSIERPRSLVLIGSRWPETPRSFPAGVVVIEDLDHPAVMAAWSRAEIGIVPSVFPDPCPTVAIEAMAAGVPLVASRVGGLPDIVADDETGVLVPVADAGQLGSALVALSADRTKRRAMARAAVKRAQAFMAGSVLDRVESVYEEAVA
jgi:glycosyltransferase involved in cell wall biosynthesis